MPNMSSYFSISSPSKVSLPSLTRLEEWKKVIDGETVRGLKAAFPGIYPDEFRYGAYFAKFKKADPENEEFMMLLLKLKFPEVYALCSS